MNARFEFGKNFIEILNFKHYPEDLVFGSPYNTVFDLRVQSQDGRFKGEGYFEVDLKDVQKFVGELQEMYDLKRQSVKLTNWVIDDQEVELIMEPTGQITVYGSVSSFTDALEFEFEADQTALPVFIKGLKEILREYDL